MTDGGSSPADGLPLAADCGGPRLILASGSPRRRELLSGAGYEFEVIPPSVDEAPLPGEDSEAMVRRLALEKARAVAAAGDPNVLVLGVDTTVDLEGSPIGKPRDAQHAADLLLSLAGRTHTVYSGYAFVTGDSATTGVTATRVTMRSVSRREAEEYVAGGEPLDKAGAYAAQGEGRRFIGSLEGSFTNVMGLPMEDVAPMLHRHGVRPAESPAQAERVREADMHRMRQIGDWLVSEEGANLVEYALLVAFIALVAVAAVTFLGTETTSKLNEIGSGL